MKKVGKFIKAIVVGITVSVLMAFPTMWIWNWLMPSIFGIIKIGYLQALGLNVLAGIFFKNNSASSR